MRNRIRANRNRELRNGEGNVGVLRHTRTQLVSCRAAAYSDAAMRGRYGLALVLLVGCGDNTQLAAVDAAVPPEADSPPSVCWYEPSEYTPGGTITLGTGPVTFEPMPDDPVLEPPGMQIPASVFQTIVEIGGQ